MSVIHNDLLLATDEATGYNLTKSLRFRSSASAYLSRTPASAGNRSTWTFSAWVKKANLTAQQVIFSGGTDVNCIYIEGGDGTIGIDGIYNGTRHLRYTTAVFRDPAAWYHIVAVLDTTQATDTNRLKMFVNGVQVALPTAAVGSYPAQNSTGNINTALTHSIGRRQHIPDNYYDGYVTEVNFIDGQALTPSSFGETDTITGVWKPKAYTGTYGTNGFYLPFTDVATTSGSNAGLGKDFSGNGNYWTTNNISVTSGATYDSMTDVPTLTSATAANYCVGNPLSVGANTSLTNGNLSGTLTGSGGWAGTICGLTSGKWYYEATVTANSGNSMWIGFLSDAYTKNDNAWSYSTQTALYANDARNGNNTSYGATYTTNDVIGVAIDLSTSSGSITFYKNGVSQGVMFSSLTTSAVWRPLISGGGTGTTIAMNFGQRPFAYTPPTGFVALNTFNLPDSTIVAGNTVMDATVYAGNSTSRSITNAGAFKPDFVWVKDRTSGTPYHQLSDSVRGATKQLFSNGTDAEDTNSTKITSFDTTGFSLGNSGAVNATGDNYVAWQWQAGQGTTSSNTSGSITSTVSVNASAGFSIVSYTGTGTTGTVGHGLGVAPSMIIIKRRDAVADWDVYHASLGNGQYISLNKTDAAGSSSWLNNTSPSSAVFTLNGGTFGANTNGSATLAYCWSEIAGFSKAFSYTGNGSADGTFTYLGFRPKFILVKRSSSSGTYWNMYDTTRSTANVADDVLYANLSDAEAANESTLAFDILSNGFKARTSGSSINQNGETYIGMAFAELPFKHSLAR